MSGAVGGCPSWKERPGQKKQGMERRDYIRLHFRHPGRKALKEEGSGEGSSVPATFSISGTATQRALAGTAPNQGDLVPQSHGSNPLPPVWQAQFQSSFLLRHFLGWGDPWWAQASLPSRVGRGFPGRPSLALPLELVPAYSQGSQGAASRGCLSCKQLQANLPARKCFCLL